MEVAIVNVSGQETGKKIKLNKNIFGVEPNDHAIWLDVKQHLANQRQGTHKSKQRNEISGSSKKIHRQKTTKLRKSPHDCRHSISPRKACARSISTYGDARFAIG